MDVTRCGAWDVLGGGRATGAWSGGVLYTGVGLEGPVRRGGAGWEGLGVELGDGVVAYVDTWLVLLQGVSWVLYVRVWTRHTPPVCIGSSRPAFAWNSPWPTTEAVLLEVLVSGIVKLGCWNV